MHTRRTAGLRTLPNYSLPQVTKCNLEHYAWRDNNRQSDRNILRQLRIFTEPYHAIIEFGMPTRHSLRRPHHRTSNSSNTGYLNVLDSQFKRWWAIDLASG